MEKKYHLDLSKKQINAAKIALMPGDPFRVEKIAKELDSSYENLAFHREYKSALVELKEQPVLVVSTGIGGPSTAIAVEELAGLGVETFIRLGTCGSIQERVNIGDMVISSGAVRLDGTSTHYAPREYPAVAHHSIVNALEESAKELSIPYHVGVTASSDTFYPGQERYDTFSKYVIKRFQKSIEEWRNLNVLNFEMESAALFTMCQAFGLKAGTVCGVIAQRVKSEKVATDKLPSVEINLGEIVKTAVLKLLS